MDKRRASVVAIFGKPLTVSADLSLRELTQAQSPFLVEIVTRLV